MAFRSDMKESVIQLQEVDVHIIYVNQVVIKNCIMITKNLLVLSNQNNMKGGVLPSGRKNMK